MERLVLPPIGFGRVFVAEIAIVHLKSGVCVLNPLGCFETPVFQNRLDGFKTGSCFGTEWFQNTSSVLKHSDESECFETARVS